MNEVTPCEERENTKSENATINMSGEYSSKIYGEIKRCDLRLWMVLFLLFQSAARV